MGGRADRAALVAVGEVDAEGVGGVGVLATRAGGVHEGVGRLAGREGDHCLGDARRDEAGRGLGVPEAQVRISVGEAGAPAGVGGGEQESLSGLGADGDLDGGSGAARQGRDRLRRVLDDRRAGGRGQGHRGSQGGDKGCGRGSGADGGAGDGAVRKTHGGSWDRCDDGWLRSRPSGTSGCAATTLQRFPSQERLLLRVRDAGTIPAAVNCGDARAWNAGAECGDSR